MGLSGGCGVLVAAFGATVADSTGTAGLMPGIAALAVTLRCNFGATGTGGWLGAASGGKSCADERPGGIGVAIEGGCDVNWEAGGSIAWLAVSLAKLSPFEAVA